MKPIKADIINIDKKNRTAIVRTNNGSKFPVKITINQLLLEDIRLGDTAIITKSSVSHKWLMIDYSFCNPFNYAVHNSLQKDTESEDLILNEEGIPYDF